MRNPTIGFWGGMALLVSSITGPGLTTGIHSCRPGCLEAERALTRNAVPLLFQQAGWLLYGSQ